MIASRLYLVCGALDAGTLDSVVRAGVDIVQLRMKDADATRVIEAAEPFSGVCGAAGVPFVVNDRPDVALAVGADGVHLGQDDLPPDVARGIVGPDALIGRSTHSADDIERAKDEHAAGNCDYIAVGPVYHTATHPERPAVGLELVRYAAEHVAFPWFAIGGIDRGTVGDVVRAGATRVAVVRAIVDAPDPAAAAAELRGALA